MDSWLVTGNFLGTHPLNLPPNGVLGTKDNNELVIQTNGQERVRIDTTGNVGIGTSAPASNLHVNVPGSSNPISAMSIDVRTFGTASNAQASHFLQVRDVGSGAGPCFVIRGDGNVGIGTSKPQQRLTVTNGDSAVVNVYSNGGSVGVIDAVDPNSPATGRWLSINPTGGNVGVGTQSPAAQLSVVAQGATELVGNAKSGTLLTSSRALGANISSESVLASFGLPVEGNNVSLSLRAIRTVAGQGWPTCAIGFGMDVDDTPRAGASLCLHANGNVGIGTSTPAWRLDVNGDIAVNGVDAIRRDPSNAYIFPFGTKTTNNNVVVGGGPGGNTSLQVAGDVRVSGDIFLTGADCAEDFDATRSEPLEPGTVVVIDEHGALTKSCQAYDRKVAGVVSGGGEYRHGLVLDKRPSEEGRIPVALVGKVYCKVDAQYSPIEVGDLLTTSLTPGHAMKAVEPAKAFGSVLGKALRPVAGGKGLIPILIALQ